MGRRPESDEEVREKVLAYCERYGVAPGAEGLPPFPSGRRETPQHREWLTVYRALRRLRARTAGSRPPAPAQTADARAPTVAPGTCPVCARVVEPDAAAPFSRAGRRSRSQRLHPACADLARLAEKAGPEAVARLSGWLWPPRRRRA